MDSRTLESRNLNFDGLVQFRWLSENPAWPCVERVAIAPEKGAQHVKPSYLVTIWPSTVECFFFFFFFISPLFRSLKFDKKTGISSSRLADLIGRHGSHDCYTLVAVFRLRIAIGGPVKKLQALSHRKKHFSIFMCISMMCISTVYMNEQMGTC